jgi:osmotically inducible protein OsmC
MVARHAEAEWKGDGPHGEGHMRLESGTLDAPFDFRSRMENGKGTNPEELLGAAHAGCFSMQLAFMLTKAGTPPARIHTKADVHFGPKGEGFAISRIDLHTEGSVPGLDEASFERHAQAAKQNCPLSQALAGVEIHLDAKLLG